MATQAVKRNVLQQFVERAGSLYSLPAVALEVLELTERANVDTDALRRCVERDPALTAKLLRVVNSSMFGLSRAVSDLRQALALLGVKPLKLLVLGFSLPKELYSGVEARTLQQFWQFTLVKGVAARELAKTFWSNDGDESFIASLLQEIGVLALVNELGDSYINFLSGVHARGENLIQLETATLGFDHAIFSARLLDYWNLPEPMVKAVAVPHDIQHIVSLDPSVAMVPQTLHLATLIASIIVSDRGDLMAELVEAAARYRDIRVEQIDELLDRLHEQVELMAQLFAVSLDQPDSYRDIMSRAHQQMSDAAIDALPDMVGATYREREFAEQEVLHSALDRYAQSFLDLPASESSPEAPRSRQSTEAETHVPVLRPEMNGNLASTDPGLHGRIAAAIAQCRARQRELSLMLAEIDNFENLIMLFGPDRIMRLVAAVSQAIQSLSDIPCECLVISDTRVAVVLPDCDRQQALCLARTLSDAVPAWLVEQGKVETHISFSTGIASLATPTHSSRPDKLIDAADRCLFAARQSGGGVIKSIDVL